MPLWKRKTMRTVELTYQNAPFANEILPLLSEMLQEARGSLSAFLFCQLRHVADYIGIATQIEQASVIYPKHTLARTTSNPRHLRAGGCFDLCESSWGTKPLRCGTRSLRSRHRIAVSRA